MSKLDESVFGCVDNMYVFREKKKKIVKTAK